MNIYVETYLLEVFQLGNILTLKFAWTSLNLKTYEKDRGVLAFLATGKWLICVPLSVGQEKIQCNPLMVGVKNFFKILDGRIPIKFFCLLSKNTI